MAGLELAFAPRGIDTRPKRSLIVKGSGGRGCRAAINKFYSLIFKEKISPYCFSYPGNPAPRVFKVSLISLARAATAYWTDRCRVVDIPG